MSKMNVLKGDEDDGDDLCANMQGKAVTSPQQTASSDIDKRRRT